MGVGSVLVALSLLAGLLTSSAAATERVEASQAFRSAAAFEYKLVVSDYAAVDRQVMGVLGVDEQVPVRIDAKGAFVNRTPGVAYRVCDVIFDGYPLMFQTDYARDQFAVDPWRKQCGSMTTDIVASVHDHIHLDYQNPDIGPCFTGPLAGQYGVIHDDGSCTEFDPLTEPRIAPRTHFGDEVIEVRMYDDDGYQNFGFDRIRVVSGPMRVCVHEAGAAADTMVINSGASTPNGTCWNLDEGYWNLSGHDIDAHLVTLTTPSGSGAPFAFDDIRLDVG